MFKFLKKTIYIVCKYITLSYGIIISIFIIFILFLSVLSVCEWFWPEWNGSYNLGNNIYMLEWDGGGRVIVNAWEIRGKTCFGGEQLIPTYENGYDSLGRFAEYVVDAKADDNWVIVRTNNHVNSQRKYYIINKQYNPEEMTGAEIVDTKIECFTDSNEFVNKCFKNGIDIKW